MTRGHYIALSIFGAIGLTVLLVYSSINGLRTESIQHETRLSAQFLDNQNYLSTYTVSFYEQVGVADMKSDRMDAILANAVKGRYDEEGFGADGGFFSAISEAYPDLEGLDVYDRIIDHVSAGREGYRATQSKLLDMIRAYDVWRYDGMIQSRVVAGVIGAPTDRLVAKVGDRTWKGEEAHNQMSQIVLASQAIDAYSSGTLQPLVGGDDS